ncbi:MAG: alpha/beta hydrolase, partial [Cyanobacteria bacterium J06632_22]
MVARRRALRIWPKQFLHRATQALAAGLVAVLAASSSARSAENIYFDYGPLGRVLPVSSLEAYAADGTVDEVLAPYLDLLPAGAQAELQQILSMPLTELSPQAAENLYSPFVLSQWLEAPIGAQVLLRTGEGFQTAGRFNGQQALRGAMVLAAADPDGLTLLNILRYFPTDGIRIDLVKLLALGQAIQTNFETTEQLVVDMTQLSQAAAATEPELDYGALPLLSEMTPFEVAERSLMVEDPGRNRSFPVDLYFPRDLAAGPIPVMVFSHGYGDTRTNPGFVELARSLAANGFLVALPEHIGSNAAYQEDLALGLVD